MLLESILVVVGQGRNLLNIWELAEMSSTLLFPMDD